MWQTNMLPPYLKSGSEFSAVQWRLFPLWASVVRGYWYLSLPNFFVKLLNSTLTECENQSNFFMQRLQGYHAWCINFWLRQFRFSWGCQLTLELPGFKSTHKIDYLRYQFFLWNYTGFSKGRFYWEKLKSMLILHKLISWLSSENQSPCVMKTNKSYVESYIQIAELKLM